MPRTAPGLDSFSAAEIDALTPYFGNVDLDNAKMDEQGGLKVVKFKVQAVIKPPKKIEKPAPATKPGEPVAKG